ncbi:polyprenyl synthetase family protein [Actinomadura sp. HBU206391]|uniref:polyprenyl synthetase family protein n=1 Tax=Actinomadura sp. HBU206391 TaxID=2731692 RepID=UPI00164EE732|nr:polyprenyl synthetase family protein [Actinomadura sp. HBU206391]MBC6458309.1 polyprenyl synthetase family protein [Actinomadura sp. HBU206391]
MPSEIPQPLTTGRDVTEILTRTRGLVAPALRKAVQQLHPHIGGMAGYALGLREVDGTSRVTPSGKGLRPAIVLLSARAVGARPEAAIDGAVAVELLHTFSLVHDDIMDGDERRRHRDTVWKAYGVGPSVLTGDTLLALAMDTLAQAGTPQASAALRRLSATLAELVQGQAEDVAFEVRPWTGPDAVTVKEYMAMAGGKTGALLACAGALGALLGGGSASATAAMSKLGRHLGLAFQAVDDLLGIWGDPEVTGKPVFSDLRSGKKTLPVVAALAHDRDGTSGLAALLGSRTDDVTLRRAAGLIRELGGLAYTREQAELHVHEALRLLDIPELDRTAAGELAALARFLVDRTH